MRPKRMERDPQNTSLVLQPLLIVFIRRRISVPMAMAALLLQMTSLSSRQSNFCARADTVQHWTEKKPVVILASTRFRQPYYALNWSTLTNGMIAVDDWRGCIHSLYKSCRRFKFQLLKNQHLMHIIYMSFNTRSVTLCESTLLIRELRR